MKHYFTPDEYFLVEELETGQTYAIHTIYKIMFKANRPSDVFPGYLLSHNGLIRKEIRKRFTREQLDYLKELV